MVRSLLCTAEFLWSRGVPHTHLPQLAVASWQRRGASWSRKRAFGGELSRNIQTELRFLFSAQETESHTIQYRQPKTVSKYVAGANEIDHK